MIHGHGGNVHELARHLGCAPADIADMSSNVNPLGPMSGLVAHLERRMADITRLPEVDAATMTGAYAHSVGLPVERMMAGNGSTEILYLLPRVLAPERAFVLGPTYADYADACRLADIPVQTITAEADDGFEPPLDRLEASLRAGDLVFICNPNNPTGRRIDTDRIVRLAKAHPACRFLVDESYLPFCGHGRSAAAAAPDNLLVLSSLSKIHRIPGLRIGFVAGPPSLVSCLAAHRLPWSVNALAQAAVVYLCRHPDAVAAFVEKTRRFLADERRRLVETLSASHRLRVFDSHASFLLMALQPPATADRVCRGLATHRILVRDAANFTGLDERYIRISLKDRETNDRLAACLLAVLDRQGKREPSIGMVR